MSTHTHTQRMEMSRFARPRIKKIIIVYGVMVTDIIDNLAVTSVCLRLILWLTRSVYLIKKGKPKLGSKKENSLRVCQRIINKLR